jgi:phosphoribosylanthranilate isomerase
MKRTRIKICGITRPQDAIAACDAGCDAIGLVFWSGSPRCLTFAQAAEVAATIAPEIEAVGVFVGAEVKDVISAARQTGIATAQLHGDLPPGPWDELGKTLRLIRAIPVNSRSVDGSMRVAGIADYLFDSAADGRHGGTGRTFDWHLIEPARGWGRIWLAGGLNASNIDAAIRTVAPYAVDVSSGVESAPGIKSPELITAFVRAVRAADSHLPTQ